MTSDSLLESKFDQLTKQAIRDSSVTFRVDTLTNFEWDTLIIIPTYWSIERLELETQINLTAAKKAGQYREDLNILAFTKNRQLIKCIELPRTKGDFATLKSVMFSRENCVFEFVRTTNKFLATGQPVVEGRIPR
ncbi:MAG: hypothetical protein IPP64_14460 [Bacteroidetes bacterium]|nr:hypothetical protein [Bacteroidota bacterium]